jgi:hypothetical protein
MKKAADMSKRRQKRSISREGKNAAPHASEFLRFSQAVDLLTARMFAALPPPRALIEFRKKRALIEFGKHYVNGGRPGIGKGPVGFTPWRAAAAAEITQAGRSGSLTIYMAPDRPVSSDQISAKPEPAANSQPTPIPLEVLTRLMTSHGGFSDHPIRPTLKTVGGNENLLRLLTSAKLLINATEFKAWCRAEHAKGKWPSQRARKKPRISRPSKQTSSLRAAIMACVTNGDWHGKQTIASLHRMLVKDAIPGVPSADTLERFVDKLALETGDTRLVRIKRRSPQFSAPR